MLRAERFWTKVFGRGYNVRPLEHRPGSILGSTSSLYLAPCTRRWYEYILRIFHCCADNFYVVLRNFIRAGPSSPSTDGDDIYIGRSEMAMWMRIVSLGLHASYIWSLLAPVLMSTGEYDMTSCSGICSCRT